MSEQTPSLRRGWTTGACATAAVRAALMALWGGQAPREVQITLPRGETPWFAVAHRDQGPGWCAAGIVKDAGDDPDVTHGAMIIAKVCPGGTGLRFRAGEGVGTVTKPGLPVPVGDPAINPVPRQMIAAQVSALAARYGQPEGVEITLSIPGGAEIAQRTWNPRLGIVGGLSVLGTTGIVRPFSCAAWIASIHRGVDVARAQGLPHVAGCTGASSESTVRALYDLPEGAMLDMGDFAGGLLKYLRQHPVPRVTIGGGIAKMVKLAQGARDLHSARSQVDFAALAAHLGDPRLEGANTVLEAHQIAPDLVARYAAEGAFATVQSLLRGADIAADVVVVDRTGRVLARADAQGVTLPGAGG